MQKPLAGIPEGIELETIVTELDINYGLGDRIPWGFQKVNLPIVQGQRGSKPRDAVWITFRKGMKRRSRTPCEVICLGLTKCRSGKSPPFAFQRCREIQDSPGR